MIDPIVLGFGGLFLAALVAALVLTPLARRVAIRIGLVDAPGARKIHVEPTPYGGGLALWFVVTGLLALCYWIVTARPEALPAGLDRALDPYLHGARDIRTLHKLAAILGGGTVVFALGLIDDRWGLRPRWKLLGQVLAAALVMQSGIRLTLFVESPYFGIAATLLWIVFVTNAFNLLDNMDGLSGGVAAVAGAIFFVIAVQGGEVFVAAVLAVLVGALLGFLRYNFTPARLFMGDAGSLFIGFLLATLTVTATFYKGRGPLAAVAMPVLVLGVALFDSASVIVIRLRAGRSIFEGDKNHFSHRLTRLGFSRRGAVLTIYLLGVILGGLALLLRQLDTAGTVVLFAVALGVILLIVLLETVPSAPESESESNPGPDREPEPEVGAATACASAPPGASPAGAEVVPEVVPEATPEAAARGGDPTDRRR